MTRVLAVAVVLAGCASGASNGQAPDASQGGHDAPVAHDASIRRDAVILVDSSAPDAAPIDAPPPQVDASPIDAAPPPPIDACVPVQTQLLANPTFDLDPAGTGWAETQTNGFEIVGAYVTPEESAPYSAWLGGVVADDDPSPTATDQLSQNVVVPAGTTELTLTGYYAVITDETTTTHAYDTADLALTKVDGTPIDDIQALTNLSPANAWTAVTHAFNVTGLAGATVRLRMTSTNDDKKATSFFFDTLALTATHCP